MMLPTHNFTVKHASSSSTFHPPPLDGSLVVHQLYDYNAVLSPHHPLFVYTSPEGLRKTLTWSDAQFGIHRGAKYAMSALEGVPIDYSSPQTVLLLANTDTITYHCFLIGMQRAGYLPFPILHTNRVVDIAKMLTIARPRYLFVSKDEATQDLYHHVLEHLSNDEAARIKILNMPVFEDLFPPEKVNDLSGLLPPTPQIDLDRPAITYHTSGTGATPKIRTLTHRIQLQRARTPWYGERDLCGEIMAAHALPLAHASSVFSTCWAASTGLILSCFHPATPAVPLTPANQVVSAVGTGTTLLYTFASWFDAWSTNSKIVEILKTKFKALVIVRTDESSGDALDSQGVTIWRIFAATEMSTITSCMPERSLKFGWAWTFFSPHVQSVMIPRGISGDVCELVVMSTPMHTPAVINYSVNGQPAYLTGDLFLKHPTEPDLWKFYGRVEDQISLVNGEETNPAPLEYVISKCPLASSALIFGNGKQHNGVLIEPRKPFDPKDNAMLSKFRDDVWPDIQRVNLLIPDHLRISKELIIVSNPSKPLDYSPKRIPRRWPCMAIYKDEIDEVYASLAQGTAIVPSAELISV